MALNPHTLFGLYNKGIIDYVPMDLLMPMPMGAMNSASNPYLNMATQGNLYQNHGCQSDCFTPSAQYSGINNQYSNLYPLQNNVQAGSRSRNNTFTTFTGIGVGTKGHSTSEMFGVSGVGTRDNTGANMYGEGGGIGSRSTMGLVNASGGYADAVNEVESGVNGAVSVYNKTPGIIKGLIAGTIGIVAICSLFKRGGKPKVNSEQQKTFWQKINPFNWFKKSKK